MSETASDLGRRVGLPGPAPLHGEYANMLQCIRCGLCLSVCPTYQLTLLEQEGPRGRIAMARAVAEGHLDVTPDFAQHEESCLLCDACTAVCPAGVRMEELGVAVRTVLAERAPSRNPVQRLLEWAAFRVIFPDMRRFRAQARLLRWYQRSGLQARLRRSGLLKLLRLDRVEAYLPSIDAEFLVPTGQVWEPKGAERRRVALFAGCVMSTAFAETDRATARVLAANGCRVEATAGQGCCGALHAHGGDRDMARELARRNIAAFETSDADTVVVNAAGCGAMLKEYSHLLADAPAWAERARVFVRRVRDFTEFLGALGPVEPPRPLAATVTYQDPCHLAHAQRVKSQPRQLLRIAGVKLVEMRESDMCCGSAGIYNLTHPGMADQLQARKLDNAAATQAPTIVTANPGCLIQLQAGAARRGLQVEVRHIADVLDAAYGEAGDAR